MSMHAQLLHTTRRSTAAEELVSARPARRLQVIAISFVLMLGALFGLAANTSAQHYQQTNLVSDVPGMAATTDPHLVNPWGIARSQTSPWWVADNGTGVSTLYTGTGQMLSLVVTIPPPPGGTPPSSPTGIVFNRSSDFQG